MTATTMEELKALVRQVALSMEKVAFSTEKVVDSNYSLSKQMTQFEVHAIAANRSLETTLTWALKVVCGCCILQTISFVIVSLVILRGEVSLSGMGYELTAHGRDRPQSPSYAQPTPHPEPESTGTPNGPKSA